MLTCGLLGEKLGHSFSPRIHALLGTYTYDLFEKKPEEAENFIRNGAWDAINVTIPYKKTAAALCDVLSERARRLKSVNTLVRRADGRLFGDNTDWFGFETMIRTSGLSVAGKKALVLGSGGTSVTVQAVLRQLGAEVVVISRGGENNYGNLDRHRDAGILVNTTPVGMYPNNGKSPLDLAVFERLEAVFDVIYNPARTALMLQAERRGIPSFGGLTMLAAQAALSSRLFQGEDPAEDPSLEEISAIVRQLSSEMENIVLIGMPGVGKTTIAEALARKTSRKCAECDLILEKKANKKIPQIFAEEGESYFRQLEQEILAEVSRESGLIISTGGGCVTRPENYDLLHQNSRIFWVKRDLSLLDYEGRPMLQRAGAEQLFREREPLYRQFADYVLEYTGTPEQAAEEILKKEWDK